MPGSERVAPAKARVRGPYHRENFVLTMDCTAREAMHLGGAPGRIGRFSTLLFDRARAGL